MPAEVAKAIVTGGTYFETPAAEGAENLIKLARNLAVNGDPYAWYAAIEDADADSIILTVGAFGSTIPITSGTASFREAARSMIERKLNSEMLAKMRDLEAVTVKLERRALLLGWITGIATIVGTILGGLSLWRMS